MTLEAMVGAASRSGSAEGKVTVRFCQFCPMGEAIGHPPPDTFKLTTVHPSSFEEGITAWRAVDCANRSAHSKSNWAGLIYID